MTRCDLRSHSECSCLPGECAVAPMRPIMDTSDTPVIQFTARQQLFLGLLLALFFSALWFGAFYGANVAYGKQFKIEQESSVHVARN